MKRHSKIRLLRDFVLSLCYNDFISWSYVLDTLLEPLLWMVDGFAKVLGPLFVTGVFGLTTSVIAIVYKIGLPYYWQHKGPWVTVPLIVLGQYIKVNIAFHYWKALTIHPGRVPLQDLAPSEVSDSSCLPNGDSRSSDYMPVNSGGLFQRLPPITCAPEQVVLKQVTSICKKCIGPKPPRTHHCSVCDACVLKMDHHCPWLNSCVGHFNHRHFFLYMAYMIAGCAFIMAGGFEIFYQEMMYGGDTTGDYDKFDLMSDRSLILYEAFVVTGCFFTLGGLTAWHAKLISRGETSIEAHINRSERKRYRDEGLGDYVNPYDFGSWKNWCLLLGMTDGRGWSSVLLPSAHPAKGDGLAWDSVYSCDVKWNEYPDTLKRKLLDSAKIA